MLILLNSPLECSRSKSAHYDCFLRSTNINACCYSILVSRYLSIDLQPSFILFPSDSIYHFCEGHDATQHAAFGEAVHIAITLRFHEEAAYEGLDPIECEVRKRIFWILFGGMDNFIII